MKISHKYINHDNVLKSNQEKIKFWTQHQVLQKQSGLSRRSYCQDNNLNYHTFCYWSKKAQSISSPLIPVVITAVTEVPMLLCSIKLNNGYILNIHNMDVVSVLLERAS